MKGKDPLVIRKLELDDLIKQKKLILELMIDSYEKSFQISREQCLDICNEKLGLLPDYMNDGSAIVIGAFLDERIVGFLWLYKHKLINEPRLHVNQIVVSNQFRGKGIGKLLMKEAEEQAKQLRIQTIDLFVSVTNIEAIKMYNAMGYATERWYIKKNIGEKNDAANN